MDKPNHCLCTPQGPWPSTDCLLQPVDGHTVNMNNRRLAANCNNKQGSAGTTTQRQFKTPLSAASACYFHIQLLCLWYVGCLQLNMRSGTYHGYQQPHG